MESCNESDESKLIQGIVRRRPGTVGSHVKITSFCPPQMEGTCGKLVMMVPRIVVQTMGSFAGSTMGRPVVDSWRLLSSATSVIQKFNSYGQWSPQIMGFRED